jgi:hypothetical protein
MFYNTAQRANQLKIMKKWGKYEVVRKERELITNIGHKRIQTRELRD